MPGCLVPGCTSGYKSNVEKVHLFTVPIEEELKNKWQIAIKRPHTLISKAQVVCEKHFRSGDIIRTRQLLDPDGNIVGVSPYQRPRLAPKAVPSLFPWTEVIPAIDESKNISESSPTSAQVSELPKSRNIPEEINVSEVSEFRSSTGRQEHISDHTYYSCNVVENFNFSTLLSYDLNLPSSWMRNNITHNGIPLISFSVISCEVVDGNYYSFNLKEIMVDSSLKLYTNIMEKTLTDSSYITVKNNITNIKELEEYIRTINGLKVCKGTTIDGLQEYEKSSSLYTDKIYTIRHKSCTLLCSSIQCTACQNAKRAFVRKRKRHEIKSINKKFTVQEIPVGSKTRGSVNTNEHKLKQKLNRSIAQNKKLRLVNMKLRKNLKACQSQMSSEVANNQCNVVQEILKAKYCSN